MHVDDVALLAEDTECLQTSLDTSPTAFCAACNALQDVMLLLVLVLLNSLLCVLRSLFACLDIKCLKVTDLEYVLASFLTVGFAQDSCPCKPHAVRTGHLCASK